MDQKEIRFVYCGDAFFIHADDLANAIRVKSLVCIREAIAQATANGDAISEEIISVFNSATHSAINAIDDLKSQTIKIVQAECN